MIVFYTIKEGGYWHPWPFGHDRHIPSQGILNLLYGKHNATVTIFGVKLHSFKTNANRVWDTVNGWRDHDNAE